MLFAALLLFFLPRGNAAASDYEYGYDYGFGYEYGADPYAHTFEDYAVEMTVSSDCTVKVKEVLRVSFTGSSAHGIIRDFSLGGVTYSDFSVTCDDPDFSPYFSDDQVGVLSLYLRGRGLVKGEERTYTLNYTMQTHPVDGALPLDVLGFGFTQGIRAFHATLSLPAGYEGTDIYSGKKGTEVNAAGIFLSQTKEGERTVLSFEGEFPLAYEADGVGLTYGVTLNVRFAAGALTPPLHPSLIFAIAAGVGLLVVALFVKFFVCRRPTVIKPVGLEAPNRMDPLLMGTIIDGTVDGEDLGALAFWLAAEGYLHIDLTDEDDPLLTRVQKNDDALPEYARDFYRGLFQTSDSVSVGSLGSSFYGTAERVRKGASEAAGKPFAALGNVCLALLAVLCVALFGIYTVLREWQYYLYFVGAACCAVAFALAAVPANIAARRAYKWKAWKRALVIIGGLVAGAVVALFSALFPGVTLANGVVPVCTAVSAAVGAIAGSCVVLNKKRAKEFGEILGFKNFILYTEKDRIEFMLKEDPELYYRILPYAQVLGVTDAWTEKFEGLDMHAPAYCDYGMDGGLFDLFAWNLVFRSFGHSFRTVAPVRPMGPVISGRGGFGGGFGGFGGGGFGGGGSRGC